MSDKKSGFLFNPVFWNTFFSALAFSVIAKFLVGKLIPAPSAPGFKAWRATGIWYPDPFGWFALTHIEHWHDSWPDYTEGLIGWAALNIGGLIEKFVDYQNAEPFVYFGFLFMLLLMMFGPTFKSTRDRCLFYYIAAGLLLATFVSNQGEVALFGHATDFLVFRLPGARVVIANFADVMAVVSLPLLFFVAPRYKENAVKMGKAFESV